MTECEKFVKEGIFEKSFFEAEIRNDFLVDEERKKIWAVELDMLLLFDKVCKKHNIKYFLWGGSMLGAVRHKGMIPWDDDIDVALFRDDYEKLLSLAEEFTAPYFLQTPLTDPQSGYSHAKIRNSNTCAFNKLWGYRDYNFGIYLDIFPIDNRVEEGLEERFEAIERYNVENSLYMKMPSPYKNERDIQRIKNHSGKEPPETFVEIQKIATQVNNIPSPFVMTITDTALKMYKNRFYVEDFANVELVPFEGFLLPIPSGWDRILTTFYGDYMEFPPIEKRVNKHYHTIFLPDVPYKEFEKPIDVTNDKYYQTYIEYGKTKINQQINL